jgi:hypothetical protein
MKSSVLQYYPRSQVKRLYSKHVHEYLGLHSIESSVADLDPHIFGHPDPDPLVRGTDPDPDPSRFS